MNCKCCGATKQEEGPWYKLDLREEYIIQRIHVIGRQDSAQYLYKMEIQLGTTEADETILKGVDTSYTNLRELNYTLPSPKLARFITLTLRNFTQYFVICELYIYTVCNEGTYGPDCVHTCGKCHNDEPCDGITGECLECINGYQRPQCQECIDGRYGSSCVAECGECRNSDTCDKSNGFCPNGCSAGYQGKSCTQDCSFGTYGLNCSEKCGACKSNTTCNNLDGSCAACVTRYIGPLCKECTDDRYGSTCSNACGHCYNNERCDRNSGNCPHGCSAGYRGSTCKEACSWGSYGLNCTSLCGNCEHNGTCSNVNGTCISCVNGYNLPQCKDCIDNRYGPDCKEECGHCNNNDTCDKSNGNCTSGCSAGYQGTNCKIDCTHGTYGLGCRKKCGHCLNNKPCNKIHGDCVTCAAGFQRNKCVEACANGTFGESCSQSYGNCVNDTVCESTNGECELGCMSGYLHPYCIEAVPLHVQSNGPIGPIAGGVAGTVVVVAIVAVIVIFLLKRRRKAKSMSSSNQSFQDINANAVTDAPEQKQPEASVHVNREENSSPVKKQKKPQKQDIVIVEDQSFVSNDLETENVYYSFLSKKSDLQICQLWDYIKFKKTEDCVIFYQEYNRLSKKLIHPYDVAMKPMNRGKNRYKSLFAYDHSRVPLVVEDCKEVEYINASFIDGYNKPHKFIASQGPIESMRDDFWRMVWQQKSKSIVMLTNLVENGSDKCILYWPTSTKKTVTFGKITIALLSEDSTVDYVIRHMEISKEGEDSTLSVTQFHYKAWPDKSYPDSTWSLVKFWLKVEEDTSIVTDSGPIVVHCSAGIGRTGTYIALDNAYYQAKEEGTVRILDVVKTLREQRVGMVQTQDQYVYLHDAVADALLFGTHFIWSSQFEDAYAFLSQKEKGSYVTRLHTQFNIIVESISDKRSVHTTVEDGTNDYTNVFIPKKPAQVSIDEYRPKSKSLVYVREVGALILQNHEAKDAFIVCKSPTESRMTEFWSLIKEQNIKTIVSLADMAMVSSKSSSFLGLKSKAVQDKFGLSLAEERKTSIFTDRQINLKDSTDDTTISNFEYNKWASGDIVPKDPNAMAQFVEVVLDRKRRLSETEPILVFCNNGAQRCGVICALLSEVYRMNKDGGNIDIIETVKMMKERSDDIIPNVEQYVFIHDVILSRVQDHTYQN